MTPLIKVEGALAWAAQQGYSGAVAAAKEYGAIAGRKMYLSQPYYNCYDWDDSTVVGNPPNWPNEETANPDDGYYGK